MSDEFVVFGVALVVVFAYISLNKRIKRIEEKLEKGGVRNQLSKKVIGSGGVEERKFSQEGATGKVIMEADTQVKSESERLGKLTKFDVNATEIRQGHGNIHKKDTWKEFKDWIVVDWLFKLGAFLLLLGFGWLTTYAFMNNWIGPIGRITMGLIAGAGIMILGEWRIRSYKNQGAVLIALGTATVLLTVFAAREIYDFFTPLSALLIMAMVVIFVAISSVKNKSLPLAILSVFFGALAPLFVRSSVINMTSLFSYLFLLCGGTLWIIAITGWRVLSPIALGLITPYCFYFMGEIRHYDEWVALGFATLFAILFYIANVTAIIVTKKTTKSDLIVAAGNGLLLLLWISTAAPDEWQSLMTAMATLVFIGGAFVIARTVEMKEPVYVYSSIAFFLLGAATAFELSGASLTIAYTLEITAISLFVAYLTKNPRIGQLLSLLLSIPIIMSLGSMFSRNWRYGIFHKDFLVLFLLMFVLVGLGFYFYFVKNKVEKEKGPKLVLIKLTFVFSGLYFVVLTWLSLHAIIESNNIARMIALIIYTIFGLCFYVYGKLNDSRNFIITGGVVLGLVVLRLLFIEIWDMSVAGKIGTFFTIGALLLGTAFIKRDQIQEVENKD